MHPMLNTAIKAARRAGSVIMRHLGRLERIMVESKGRNDFVSEVDRIAEAEIIQIVRAAYPDHAFLAEESGRQGDSDYLWLIDPLDGTTNFLHGYPQFAVSIALQYKDRLDQAVVFDPHKNELFTASRGQGAHLNDRRMRVSRVAELNSALIATGFPFRSQDQLDAWIEIFRALALRTSGVRRPGSAALDLAYVACGRFDGFWEFGLHPWDMAAGCLLIQEAGGLTSGAQGAQDHLVTGNIVAGSPKVYEELLKIVQPRAGC